MKVRKLFIPLAGAVLFSGATVCPAYEVYNGTEFRTGYRTDYLYNGRHIAKNVAEAQVSAGFALSNYCDFNFSGQGYQSLSESFGNLGGFGEFVFYLTEQFRLRPFAAVNAYNESEFKSGVEWGAAMEYEFSKAWRAEVMGLYDTGQKGWYGNVRLHYFPQLFEDIGIKFSIGTGAGYDYFEARGVNEFFGRISVPIRINEAWNIEPFIGISDQHSQKNADTRVYCGIWASYLY